MSLDDPSPPASRRISRRAFLTALSATGLVAVAVTIDESLSRPTAASPRFRSGLRGFSPPWTAGASFSTPALPGQGLAQTGWDGPWNARQYTGRTGIAAGRRFLRLPAGLPSTAPDQPIPVYLLDHETADLDQALTFSLANATLRPGVILRAVGPFDYFGVTIEGDRLVLARYKRRSRSVLAAAPVAALRESRVFILRVQASGSSLRATVWPAEAKQSGWHLRFDGLPSRAGTPGVLVVHPTNLGPADLSVDRYELRAPAAGPTAPSLPFLITGTPEVHAEGHRLGLRAWSTFPASVVFEWTHEPDWRGRVHRSAPFDLSTPPLSAKTFIDVRGDRPLRWRVVATSPTTGARTVTADQTYEPYRPDGSHQPLVLAAACCAQLWEQPRYTGFRRLLEAAPARPHALVYQGDLGYANNSFRSCYQTAPDFFADRFERALADPYFTEIRSLTPTGLTADDHDYGPNNCWGSEVFPWTIPLWNQVQADPTDTDYYAWRLGDVHCLTLDGRRYSEEPLPYGPGRTKLGDAQFAWMSEVLRESDARLFVVYSADIFASRDHSNDCFLFGWPDEYRRAMTLFMDAQIRGKRVVILSGDAHSMRIHYHPDPADRREARGLSVVEFVCAGLQARTWSGAEPGDPTLDPLRHVLGKSGLGMATVDPPATRRRSLTLRAIASDERDPVDLFPPLHLPFHPERGPQVPPPPAPPPFLDTHTE